MLQLMKLVRNTFTKLAKSKFGLTGDIVKRTMEKAKKRTKAFQAQKMKHGVYTSRWPSEFHWCQDELEKLFW
jgi:hypothetical protein